MSKIRKSKWYSINVCSKCKHRLTDEKLMHSNGTCPYCGYTSKSTICDYIKIILKQFTYHPWWRFWDRKFTYEGRDEISKQWLLKRNY